MADKPVIGHVIAAAAVVAGGADELHAERHTPLPL